MSLDKFLEYAYHGAEIIGILSAFVSAFYVIRKAALFKALQTEVETYRGLYESVKAELDEVRKKLTDTLEALNTKEGRAQAAEALAVKLVEHAAEAGICKRARAGCPRFEREDGRDG